MDFEEKAMTVTVIVFFHAVITVGNETILPKAEKYPPTIIHKANIRNLTGENHELEPKTTYFIS